ncbi:hypothetical protein GTA08_BOTSDO13837 [Botryosphaeria dothidea]|uniref:Uncharacterized protein n=1 Tax=Botryosphaeria dothidea TaxID=55169 RepID=A0A8H4J0D7_9PEZI|nr:hypothetical protein GTA08_BOTSDO13837 [Botryosphaeria dothidea]
MPATSRYSWTRHTCKPSAGRRAWPARHSRFSIFISTFSIINTSEPINKYVGDSLISVNYCETVIYHKNINFNCISVSITHVIVVSTRAAFRIFHLSIINSSDHRSTALDISNITFL